MANIKFWQGNEAIAMGAIAAGCTFFAGYPITPSTEIMETMAIELPKISGKFLQMEDEIASIAACLGGSVVGKKTMTASSGPGISLKQELLGFAYMAEIPIVVVNVQRGGPSTGLPTAASQSDVMQARWGTHGDHATIAYAPSSVQECYEMTVKAFNMSERFRQPVLILSDEIVGHMRENIDTTKIKLDKIVSRKVPKEKPDDLIAYKADKSEVPAMPMFGDGYRWHITGLTSNEYGFPTNKTEEINKKANRIISKIQNNRKKIIEFREDYTDDADILIISYGSVSRSALRAVNLLREKGIKVGHFRPLTLWPFPSEQIEKLSKKASYIVVPELNAGQIVEEVERFSDRNCKVIGKSLINGELFKPNDIISFVKEVF